MRQVDPTHPVTALPDLLNRAHIHGFFVIESLIDESTCDQLAARLREYASGARPPATGMLLQQEPMVARGGEHCPGGEGARKIDGLYQDELFRRLIKDQSITSLLQPLLGAEMRLYRATALMKPAGVGSEKGMHQDGPYWPIAPMSMWSCWIPLDDATPENGCLVVVPGSHLDGPRAHHETQDDFVVDPDTLDRSMFVPVRLHRGSAICFHSLLLHGSAANTSDVPRRAVTISYMGEAHRHTGTTSVPIYPVVAGSSSR